MCSAVVGARRSEGRERHFGKWFEWEKDRIFSDCLDPTLSRWELQGGSHTSIGAVIKHACVTDQAVAWTGPIQKDGFLILQRFFYFIFLHVCKRPSAQQEIWSHATAVRCRKHPRGAQITFQANPSRSDGRSITPRVSLPRVHQFAAAEGHPSAGGCVGGNKATGTGRRMATFVSNRVETVNDEVKGDSQVQLQSPAQSLAPPAGFA